LDWILRLATISKTIPPTKRRRFAAGNPRPIDGEAIASPASHPAMEGEPDQIYIQYIKSITDKHPVETANHTIREDPLKRKGWKNR
jgi:hypothetical protein